MKKLLIIFIMLIFILPCLPAAASDYVLPVGPYVIDAGGCSLYNYYTGNYLVVQYTLSEAYAGMGMGDAMVHLAYYTYAELGCTYEDLTYTYGTVNNWELAQYTAELNYGANTSNTMILGCETEAADPYLSPAAALVTCTVSEDYGGGYMAGAVLMDTEGIMFIECYIMPGSADTARSFRRSILEKLTYEGVSVITDTPDPDASFAENMPETGTPVTVETAGGYTFDIEGWDVLDDSDNRSVYIQYYNKAVYITYLSHPDDGGDPYDTAKYYYDLFYAEHGITADWYEYTEIENAGELPLNYTGLLNGEYGGGYMTGAIVVNGNDVLIIEINAVNPETGWDDLDIYRGNLLKTLKLDGEAVIR